MRGAESESVGLTCTVPVLIEGANGLNGLVLESQSAGDVCAALAAGEDDIPRTRGTA